MTKNKRVTGTAMSMPGGIALGVGISVAITIIGAAILAWLLASERMSETALGYGIMLVLVLASAAGAMTACGAVKRRKLMVSGICCAGYYLALLCVALVFGGQFEGMLVHAVLVLLGGGISVILGLAGNKSGARKYKILGYR